MFTVPVLCFCPAESPSVSNLDREQTSSTPATTQGPVLVETRLSEDFWGLFQFRRAECTFPVSDLVHASLPLSVPPPGSSQPVIVAVGVVLALVMCGSCLLAGVWWKRRYCTPKTVKLLGLIHISVCFLLIEQSIVGFVLLALLALRNTGRPGALVGILYWPRGPNIKTLRAKFGP